MISWTNYRRWWRGSGNIIIGLNFRGFLLECDEQICFGIEERLLHNQSSWWTPRLPFSSFSMQVKMWFTRWFSSSLWLVAGIGTFVMWNVNADTMAANWLKAQKFIEPLGNLLLAKNENEKLRTNLHRRFGPINQFAIHSSPYRVLQSSRAFKANLTMSTNTGRTTHSSLGLWCCNLVIDDAVWLLWASVDGMIWICFRSLFMLLLLLRPLLDVSVCLRHKS